ncbi:Protein YiiM [Lachnellula suecica]|uniref:Protein YiiM n=1 Tax=Lachnellula suecica TaxID=602035 RepID=A0A8T9C6T7_9HELO|nr:Protein YiiM [Lachnellula suecica]
MGSATPVPETANLPLRIDTILQVRTSLLKQAFGGLSGIYKTSKSSPVRVRIQGCEGDQRGWEGHASHDNALLHYDSQHYTAWKMEIPDRAHLFEAGAFGENIVSENLSEDNVCIGDILRLGKEVVVQVSKPRPPCYKLNHRFEVRDMSLRSQNANRTGWYYRVLKEGSIQPGDAIVLVERNYPQWTITKVQKKLYKDVKEETAMKELAYLPELGDEIRNMFLNRWTKKIFVDEKQRLQGAKEDLFQWTRYRLIRKTRETPRICSFTFEAITTISTPVKVEPGSHIRVKLGEGGKFVRAYSVVSGDSKQFQLGVAHDRGKPRGGSEYLHDVVKTGDILSFSDMASEFPLEINAKYHVLIAGGIGITAFIASARHLQELGIGFHLYYAIRATADKAFGHLIDNFGTTVTILDGSKGQRLNLPKIISRQTMVRTSTYVDLIV